MIRDKSYDVLSETRINEAGAKSLADAANGLSFEAQIAMFPNMVTPKIAETIKSYKKEALGWKISGAGGGGYFVLVSEKRVENAMQVKIRRI